MNFRTQISIPESLINADYQNRFICMGSCFAQNMGNILTENKVETLTNPFGVIYNPLSIFDLIKTGFKKQTEGIRTSFIQNSQGQIVSLLAHSEVHASNQDNLESLFEEKRIQLSASIKSGNILILTFGSAFVYKHLKSGLDVANCHKIPAKEFSKRLLAVNEIVADFDELMNTLKRENPGLKIICTVSPVRHIRDGLVDNNISKSTLRLAIHEMEKKHEQVHYFPSYEIMMDDLRDYRFYKDDLLHPTSFAQNYIWELFKQYLFSKEAIEQMELWNKIKSDLNHRPFFPESKEHQKFLKKLLHKLQEFSKIKPCDEEITFVRQSIID